MPELFPVLRGLASLYVYLGMFEKAAQMGKRILRLAERLGDDRMRVDGNLVYGYNTAFLRDVHLGLAYLDKAIAGYDPARYRTRRFSFGNNPGVVGQSVSALFLWIVGFPDQALERANQAVTISTRLNHPYSMAYAAYHAGMLHLWRREPDLVLERARSTMSIAEQHEFLVWKAVAACLQGTALAGMGSPEEGLALVEQGMASYRDLNTPPVFWSMLLILKAQVCRLAGKAEQGLSAVDEALQDFPAGRGDLFAGEFYRLKGTLLLAQSPDHAAEAETWFLKSLEAARPAQARMAELRAAVSLTRLWQERDPDKAEQGRRVLKEVYDRFTEGFTTVDLMEANALLNR